MKVKVKPWNEAAKAALHDDEDWSVEANSIYGIMLGFGSWGKVVDGYVDNDVFYANDGLTYPFCVVDKYDEDIDDISPDDVLRYGKVIADDMLYDNREFGIAHDVRIRLIECDGNLYYHKMVDGVLMECHRVGTADA